MVQVGKEDDAKQEEEAFADENIDQILAGRTEKRQIGSRKGNTFSTATFSSNEVGICFPCGRSLSHQPTQAHAQS